MHTKSVNVMSRASVEEGMKRLLITIWIRATLAALVVVAVFGVKAAPAIYANATGFLSPPPFSQATGIFPQVVSCVQESKPRQSGPNWKRTLIVQVEPNRDPGRVREYRVLGCTLYYYHAHFR